MKAKVVRYGSSSWRVVVTHGVQSFTLRYEGTRAECRWMAKMFNKALARHDAEKLVKD